ncbi:MAG: crossover junction endodeoxyribonuclease RuvC [Thermomicrobiales bacterium]|jgi:crossover junction endodeoxyribonuclease RuvC|nr:crossover junction endodeoxyribonuclease RuvC [Thermomicrobiales bacterium]MEA2586031.1 crossover junction endodeoxyribonuclease RuvC [Thermomicrobiales bacterium]
MITLGIDPGTALLGFGVVESGDDPQMIDYGAIATSSDRAMPDRLNELFERVTALLAQYRPDVLAVEQLFFARNVTTAIAVGQARGVVLLAAARAGVPVVEYSPSEVKHAVVGYGKAEKSQMQEMVRIILGLEHVPHPDDAADALAVALCHAQRASFVERTTVADGSWER